MDDDSFCVYFGSFDALSKYINGDVEINLEAEEEDKRRPIHFVCSNLTNLHDEYQLKAIQLLIDHKVNLEAEEKINGVLYILYVHHQQICTMSIN